MNEYTKIVPLIRTLCASLFRVIIFFFIVANLSFNKNTSILLGASVVASCRIMYLEVRVVRQHIMYVTKGQFW